MVKNLQYDNRAKCEMCDKQATHAIDCSMGNKDEDGHKIKMAQVCDEHFDKVVES